MIRYTWLLLLVLVASCTSKEDKMLAELAAVEPLMEPLRQLEHRLDSMGKKAGEKVNPDKLDSASRNRLISEKATAMQSLLKIPDSLASKMHQFALQFPAHPKSEEYLYKATLISEHSGRKFEVAKWCEDYLKQYPSGKYASEATFAAANNYMETGTVAKAIEFFTRMYTKYPKSSLADQCRKTAQMLKLGLVTPEQQFNYMMNQKAKQDSARN